MASTATSLTRFYAWILAFWLLSVLVRLPQLNRPLAKHHEYNTAMVLMNIDSWRAQEGGTAFHFIPVLNYPQKGDRIPARANAPNFDAAGNALYFSFGAMWYLLPYACYQIFQWPALPIYLQLINLLLHALGGIAWWHGWRGQQNRSNEDRWLAMAGVAVFWFLPGLLWYGGNGYVNTMLSLPLLLTWLCLARMPLLQKNKGPYLLYFLVSFILVYTDWFIVFLASSYVGWNWITNRKNGEKMGWESFLRLLPIPVGILCILMQYSSYVGWEDTIAALGSRFSERSMMVEIGDTHTLLKSFFQSYLTLYLPALILILFQIRKIAWRESDLFFIRVYGTALVLYHMIFFQWSAIHEFAFLPDSLLIVYLFVLALKTGERKTQRITLGLVLFLSIAQFYYINRPGAIARDGTPYRRFQEMGLVLQTLPKDAHLFMDQKWTGEIQFHARRSIQPVANIDSARQRMKDWHLTRAFWIDHQDYQIRQIREIKPR
jgi:hypothetical protein